MAAHSGRLRTGRILDPITPGWCCHPHEKGAACAAPKVFVPLSLYETSHRSLTIAYHLVPMTVVVAPVVMIRTIVIIEVVTMMPPRTHSELDARALDVNALRHTRRCRSDRHRAHQGEGGQCLRNQHSHGSPLSLCCAHLHATSCGGMYGDNAHGVRAVRPVPGTRLKMN